MSFWMEELGSTKAVQPDTSLRLKLSRCCNSAWAAIDVSASPAQFHHPIPPFEPAADHADARNASSSSWWN